MGKTTTIRIKTKKPFTIRSKKIGEVSLHSFVRIIDLEILLNLLRDKSLDARAFTIEALNQVALLTPNKDLSNWDDKTLLTIARRWSKKVIFQEVPSKQINKFEDFRFVVSEYISKSNERMFNMLQEVQAVVAENLKVMVSELSESMMAATESISNSLKDINLNLLQSILTPFIPDFQKSISSIRIESEDKNHIRKLLESTGYELAPQIVNTDSLIKIKGKNFQPAVTNHIVNKTRTNEFIKEVEILFQNTKLKKRTVAIKQALFAHQARQYYLSTPVFIAQAEGIFTDWLLLLKLVRRNKEGRIYVNPKMGGKKLDSLKTKITYVKENLKTEGALKVAIDNALTEMVNKRNAILHGEKSNYGTAKNSTQVLILLLFLAGEIEKDFKRKSRNPN